MANRAYTNVPAAEHPTGLPSAGDTPVAYRYQQNNRGAGYITRASVEAFLRTAPDPSCTGGARYPKRYANREGQYATAGPLFEYPTTSFKYHGSQTRQKPGFVRTITDEHKRIVGISYHPFGRREAPSVASSQAHRRAAEVFGAVWEEEECPGGKTKYDGLMHVDYTGCAGQPVRFAPDGTVIPSASTNRGSPLRGNEAGVRVTSGHPAGAWKARF